MPDSLVSQNLRSMINGVSRQPDSQRLPSQGQEQINFVADVAQGLVRRPPTEHIAHMVAPLATVPAYGIATHLIELENNTRFLMVLEHGDVNVYNADTGAEVTILNNADGAPGAYTYLTFPVTDTAAQSFRTTTVADYTFIVNRSKTVTLSGTTDAGRTNDHEFFIAWKTVNSNGAANNITTIFEGNENVSTGVSTNTSSNADAWMTAQIGAATGTDVTGTDAGVNDNWKFTRVSENLVYAYQFQGALETIEIHDNFADTLHVSVATSTDGSPGAVSKFSELPSVGPEGFTVLVKGDDGTDSDEFYVSYNTAEGVWKETVAPGLDNNFEEDLMPHTLVYDQDTEIFSFEPGNWQARGAGDAITAPVPSFVGGQIKDLVVAENRLTVIAGENVIASESGDYFNFWPISATVLSDADPYDIAGTGNRVSIWDSIIPFRGNLTLFSSIGDVVAEVTGDRDAPTTVKNARVRVRGAWASSDIRPVAADDTIFFVQDHGGHTAVSQYIQSDIDVYQADEISAHVGTYIPPNIVGSSIGRNENIVTLWTGDNSLYVYRYHTLGREQVMASWCTWTFEQGATVLGADWSGSILYLTLELASGCVHIEKMDFGKSDEDEGAFTDNLGYRVHLDGLVSIQGTYNAASGLTTFALPYDQVAIGGTYRVIQGGEWGNDRGNSLTHDDTVASTITVIGDYSAYPVYIGREFTSLYEYSQFLLRGGAGESAKGARVGGRTQLRRARLVFKDTGTFDVVLLSSEDSDEYRDTFTSQFFGQAIYGATGLDEGVFDFALMGDSRNVRVQLEADTFLPAGFSSLEWEARYFQRARSA